MQKEMFEALNPDPTKQGTRVTKANYDIYKKALLKVIPKNENGIAFSDLSKAVKSHVPEKILENTSAGWWTTTVKLDLEARGIIERVNKPGKQHIRKT